MRSSLLVIASLLALAVPVRAQDPGRDGSVDPELVGPELERLSRELDDLREELEELHSSRFRELRLLLDSLQLDVRFPEDVDWPSLEEVRRQWEQVPFDFDSVLVWSDSVSTEVDRVLAEAFTGRDGWLRAFGDSIGGPDGYTFDFDAPLLLGARRVAGAELSELNPSLGRYFGTDEGVLVTDVTQGSPAEDAGLLPGDVITGVAGEPVREIAELRRAVSNVEWARLRRGTEATREITLDVLRDRATIVLALEIGE